MYDDDEEEAHFRRILFGRDEDGRQTFSHLHESSSSASNTMTTETPKTKPNASGSNTLDQTEQSSSNAVVDIPYPELPADSAETIDGFLLSINAEVRTCLDCIYHGLEVSKEQDCMGRRSAFSNDYEWFSYNQAIFKMHSFGSGLVYIGCQPNNQTLVLIYGKNNFKSLIAEFACYHYSMVAVPLYDTFKVDIVNEILIEIDAPVIVTDSNERAKQLMNIGRHKSLHSIVITSENIHQETQNYANSKNIRVYPFTELERLGSMNPVPVQLPHPNDLAIISYSGGTTGQPNGSLLTHANLVANMSAMLLHIGTHMDLRNETFVAYCSIAHPRERIMKLCMFYAGGRVGVYFGDFKDLSRDLPVLQPTIMICVPRILNRLYHRVISKVKGNWVKSRVLDVVLKSKHPETGFNEKIQNSILWDKLVFRTVKQSLGGNLKLLISGSNQISNIVLNFMRNSLGCTVMQAYDITECSTFVTATKFDDPKPQHLGAPIRCNQVKLVEVKEFAIHTMPEKIGEICVKGTNVFSGYYKREASYRENFLDDDGWFHTGDIGHWLPNGNLKFIDRKYDLSFISKPFGKLIAPNRIENIYIQSMYVGQCYVDVDFDRGYLIGIIVPDIDGINLWCSENNMLLSAAEACRNQAFRNTLTNDIISIGRREGLEDYEQISELHLESDSFTQEAGLLTPTMKVKRHEMYQFFKKEIDDIVADKQINESKNKTNN